ncbi:MAG: hypothetical protein ABSG75_15930 [Syntrophales bacterium]|jgi:hypothetical protein
MKKAGTGKIGRIKEDTLIVTIDIGLEMNKGYCTTTDGREDTHRDYKNLRAIPTAGFNHNFYSFFCRLIGMVVSNYNLNRYRIFFLTNNTDYIINER